MARRTALVTGASSGIGEAFARELAARDFDLLLTARRADRLEVLAAELRAKHGARVDVVAGDLAKADGIRHVCKSCQGRDIDLLVNNAGFGSHGLFVDLDPARLGAEVALNVQAPMLLARELLPPMIARGHGGVINLASTAAFQPVAKLAVYGATKAFVLNFSEALWAECHGTGVRVLALCPGPTETAFFRVADEAWAKTFSRLETPEEVVRLGLNALARDRPSVIVGWKNYLLAVSTRFAPRRVVALVSRKAAGLPRVGRANEPDTPLGE
jgi:short-subunit dehydrogenase